MLLIDEGGQRKVRAVCSKRAGPACLEADGGGEEVGDGGIRVALQVSFAAQQGVEAGVHVELEPGGVQQHPLCCGDRFQKSFQPLGIVVLVPLLRHQLLPVDVSTAFELLLFSLGPHHHPVQVNSFYRPQTASLYSLSTK